MYLPDPDVVAKDPLLQPLDIKHVRLRNRVLSTSHASGLEVNGMPDEAYQLYHEEKARGGVGLSMFGGSSNVDLDSPNIFRQLNVGTDAIIPYFQRFSERMHALDTALMCQITHLGRRGDPYAGDRLPTIGPSPIRETLHRSIPRQMDDHDIARVVEAFAVAALRCKEGGLDGIETLAGGHLIGQFLSPTTNRREDRFGGSIENRCRFALMVHEAMRRRVGDRFLIGIRLTIDEGPDGGLSFEDSVEIALILQKEGAVDFFNANYGRMDTTRGLVEESLPAMGLPLAPWVEPVGEFRREVGLPVFHAARISDAASARYAIAQGKLDMVGMTRAHMADPYLVAKLAAGREKEIRPCVGASHCQSPQRPSCLHNPATGREQVLRHVIPRSSRPGRKVVVVGGGPAGLEAARISAERGHDVTVYEAAPDLGGQVRIAAAGSWRRDLLGIIDWRVSELERLGVPVRLNSYMDEEAIAALTPDVVIIATGGLPQIDLQYGGDLCQHTWDLLTGQVSLRGDVLVYDGTGRHPAPIAAELLKTSGANVSYASLDSQLAEELTYFERFSWKKRLRKLSVEPRFETSLLGVEREGNRLRADLFDEITRERSHILVDHVVVEQGSLPIDEVFTGLRAQSANDGTIDLNAFVQASPQPAMSTDGFDLFRIGDAVSSRNIHSAMLDASRICLGL